ncbi:hypothetical protein HZB96_03525, partial [Candidatus Gottesmanbacteria bacterium]|nr:hypothetical protein [Candidatus Gottesmanbacteria bacterium]
RKIIIFLAILSVIFFFLIVVAMLVNRPTEVKRQPFERKENRQESLLESSKEDICGNDVCEPGLGETKAVCPQDCSAGD